MKLTRDLLIPTKIYIDVLSENGMDDLNGDPLGRLLLHLHGGKRKLSQTKIPLGLFADHLQEIGDGYLPWQSANCTSNDWLIYNSLEEIAHYYKTQVKDIDPTSISDLFGISRYNKVATGRYTCVNGTLMLKDGLACGYQNYAYDPATKKTIKKEDLKNGFLPDGNAPIHASDVIDWILETKIERLTDLAQELGWPKTIRTTQSLDHFIAHLIQIFGIHWIEGQNRTAVEDWNTAVKNRRFLLAWGTGSNIQAHIPFNPPKPPCSASSAIA
jgi:hypothetical protein